MADMEREYEIAPETLEDDIAGQVYLVALEGGFVSCDSDTLGYEGVIGRSFADFGEAQQEAWGRDVDVAYGILAGQLPLRELDNGDIRVEVFESSDDRFDDVVAEAIEERKELDEDFSGEIETPVLYKIYRKIGRDWMVGPRIDDSDWSDEEVLIEMGLVDVDEE